MPFVEAPNWVGIAGLFATSSDGRKHHGSYPIFNFVHCLKRFRPFSTIGSVRESDASTTLFALLEVVELRDLGRLLGNHRKTLRKFHDFRCGNDELARMNPEMTQDFFGRTLGASEI